MTDSEIILVKEKKNFEKKYVVNWPGDEDYAEEHHISQCSSPSIVSKLQLYTHSKEPMNNINKEYIQYRQDKSLPEKKPDTRLKSMKNRYFSIENRVVESNQKNISAQTSEAIKNDDQKVEETTETPAYLERRDYLLKKLMKSQTLPGLDDSESNDLRTDKNSNENEALKSNAEIANMKILKPMRTSEFQEEFIPLFGTSVGKKRDKPASSSESSSSSSDEADKSNKNFNPKAEIDDYRGPYPVECLIRSRRVIIDELMPYSTSTNRSNYFDRRFEILKMKIRIKSKFDNDNRLWNKIRRDTAEFRRIIDDRINARDRRFTQYKNRNQGRKGSSKKIHFDSNDSDDDILFFDHKSSTYKNLSNETVSNKNELNVNQASSDENSEEDVIRMINQQEYAVNTSSENDTDSKCRQFGNSELRDREIQRSRSISKAPVLELIVLD